MIVVGTAADAAGRGIDVPIQDGRIARKTDWLGSGDDPTLSPTVFLVDLPPDSVLDTHFHRENQFQLFVHGEGRLGRHAIRPLTVHYAGAYTGYGPLVAGPEGLTYFTIRPVYDTGALYVAQARDQMVRGPKRQLQSEPKDPIDPAALRALEGAQALDLIALQSDHIAARLLRLPPQGWLVDLDPRASGGQFLVVIAGSVRHGAGELVRLDLMFRSADEGPLQLVAGEHGAEVVLLQLPVKAEAYMGHGLPRAADSPSAADGTVRAAPEKENPG